MEKYMDSSASGSFFRFKRDDSVGEPDAESDEIYLNSCFIDIGDYSILTNPQRPQCIAVGRTGSGKSAILKRIVQCEDRVIKILPENLSLQYISNSDILGTLEKSGVKLDIFYTLLWKHVLTVELLKFHYKLTTEEKTHNWLNTILANLRKKDQSKQRALEYIKEWGDKFWSETEYRIKEITQKLESEIRAEIGAEIHGLKTGFTGGEKSQTEQRTEVIHRAQRIINGIQIKALADVLKFLSEDVFNDHQMKTYICIDKLDEGWVENDIRYRLIRSLIETLKSFRAIPAVKIVVALRKDLLETVWDKTRDAGFQEEKYISLIHHIRWTKSQLRDLLDKRVRALVRGRYTSASLGVADIFPKTVGKEDFMDYLASRTLYRPRDAIIFVNECLRRSEGKSTITSTTIQQAESEYSIKRVNALAFEWAEHYPKLSHYFTVLERMPSKFRLQQLGKERVEPYALEHMNEKSSDPLDRASFAYINGGSINTFLLELTKALYHIGVIGLKTDGFNAPRWAYDEAMMPSDGQIKPNSQILIHPMIWSRLGTIV